MLQDIFPFIFNIDPVVIAGGFLWSLALYITLTKVKNWLMEQLTRWLNFADRSLFISMEEFEDTRVAREAQNVFYASILSIIPFSILGFLSNWALDLSLGGSWSISLGILTCVIGGVFALGIQNEEMNNGE